MGKGKSFHSYFYDFRLRDDIRQLEYKCRYPVKCLGRTYKLKVHESDADQILQYIHVFEIFRLLAGVHFLGMK